MRRHWIAVLFLGLSFAIGVNQPATAQPAVGGANQPGGGGRVTPVPPPDPGRTPVTLPNLPSLPSMPTGPAPVASGAFFDDQVLLLVPIGSPPGAAQQIAAPVGMSVLREFDLATIGLHGAVLSLPPTLDIIRAIDFLALTPNAIAQPIYRYALSAGPQYALDTLRVEAAHQYATGASVTVAVIDTAIDVGHPAIAARIAGIQDFVGAAAPDVHGTAVAGLIAGGGQVAGVAPAARILAVTAFPGGSGNGATDRIAQAIDFAVASGAQVLNMSFAGPQDPVVTQLVQAALARGRSVVAAAGNGGPGAGPSWPAAVPGVIAVTATGPDDQAYSGANRGSYISIAAPGVDVLTIAPQGRVGILSGTSMAAAHVSGLVALIIERNPGVGPSQIRALLEQTAHDLGTPGRDTTYGAGRVDALSAMQNGR